MPASNPRVLIVAAEASSCLYAQRLLEFWKEQGLNVEAFGIGNEAMCLLGFKALGRAEDLAVVGLQEVMAHFPVIRQAFHDLVATAKTLRPHVVLLLDYPGFNLRLAKKLKGLGLGIPIVYYISPQVWAWRTGRVKTIRKLIDKMLVVFPFETEFYAKHGVAAEFVGHPLLDELNPKFFDSQSRALHRAKYGIKPDEVVLALMPGSRRSELKHHLMCQLESARELHKRHGNLRVALLVAPNFDKEEIRSSLSGLDYPLTLIKDEPFSMIDLSDVVLCASGTATLMVGLLEKPMVIMYKMSALTAFLAKRFVKHTKYFGLINLVLDAPVAPEFFQEQADSRHLVNALENLVVDRGERDRMSSHLAPAKDRLGSRGATERVAKVLNQYWSRSNS